MSHFPHDEPVLDVSLRVDNVPAAGRDISVQADDAQRAAIADLLGISAVDQLLAQMKAVKFRGGIRVEGRLKARTVQPCVVTFEPVVQEIDEPIDRVFLPDARETPSVAPGAEIFVDLEADDPPDPLDGPELDLSPLVIETLALALDPYPRAPGASLQATGVTLDDGKVSPFAVLNVLKDNKDKG